MRVTGLRLFFWKIRIVVECTTLERWQRVKPLAGSNPASSAVLTYSFYIVIYDNMIISWELILLIVCAALARTMLGTLWYSDLLFGRLWKSLHVTTSFNYFQHSTNFLVDIGSFLVALVQVSFVFFLMIVLGDYSPYLIGFLLWLCVVLPEKVLVHLFTPKGKHPELLWINGGYELVALMLTVFILTLSLPGQFYFY